MLSETGGFTLNWGFCEKFFFIESSKGSFKATLFIKIYLGETVVNYLNSFKTKSYESSFWSVRQKAAI